MRLKDVVAFASLGVFVSTSLTGCGQTEVEIAKAPASQPLPQQPVPKSVKSGGGGATSGNAKGNPFEPFQK